jgi:hypothetical protein
MSLKKGILSLAIFIFFISASFGQSLGAILDEESYNSIPRKASLSTRSYDGLPRTFSLKQYAPLPGDQTDYGTCVGWAAGYAARTILESVALNRMNQAEINQNVFSPVYIYKRIRPDDIGGQRGAQIHWALDLMKDSGAVKMLDDERVAVFPQVELSLYRKSVRYPITDYVTLFSRDDRLKPALITRTVKKSLYEGKPVIIGMNTPESFLEARNVWQPDEDPDDFYGGHAMCVVGYDDVRGAFEVLNSWGRKWGNAGFIWIPYTTFVNFVTEGYEIIENLNMYSDSGDAGGFAFIDFNLIDTNKYRIVIGAKEVSYVYSFLVTQAKDGSFYSPVLLFPGAGISPLLNYRNSSIVLPGEEESYTLGSTGAEYLITFYAKRAVDIQAVMSRFNSRQGTLEFRLSAALGKDLLYEAIILPVTPDTSSVIQR